MLKILEKRYDNLSEGDLRAIAGNPRVFDCPSDFKSKIGKERKESLIEEVSGFLPARTAILERLESGPAEGLPDFRAELSAALRKMSATQLCYTIDRVGRLIHDDSLHFFGPARNEAIAYHEINRAFFPPRSFELVFQVFGKSERENFLLCDHERMIDKEGLVSAFMGQLRRYSYVVLEVAEAALSYDKGLGTKGFTQLVGKAIRPYVRAIDEDKAEAKVRRGTHKFEKTWALDLGDDDEED